MQLLLPPGADNTTQFGVTCTIPTGVSEAAPVLMAQAGASTPGGAVSLALFSPARCPGGDILG